MFTNQQLQMSRQTLVLLFVFISLSSSAAMAQHPCESDGKILYQTLSIGPCADLNAQVSDLKEKLVSVPRDLSGIKMRNMRPPFSLASRNLYFADFNQAFLSGMRMDGSNFDSANLAGVSAWHSHWRNASFRGANLAGAKLFAGDFQFADFTAAKLMHADLSFADLRMSNLSDANLSYANTIGAKFEGARFTARTKLPFSEERALRLGMKKVDEESP